MLRDIHRTRPVALLCLEWLVSEKDLRALHRATPLGRLGWYSFEPAPNEQTHNCVTWAFSTINAVLGKTLPMVRKGRMKLATQALLELGARPSQ